MKKKILIIGPIGHFGGRDVEVNIIVRSLKEDYEINVFSTGYLTEDSFAVKNMSRTNWNSIDEKLFKNNFLIRLLSWSSKFFNRGKKKAYGNVRNSVSKKIFDLDNLAIQALHKEIIKSDLVILCVQLTTKFLPEIVSFCKENNIPCLLRTTGTIRKIPEDCFEFLKKVDLFIHHSEANAANLNQQVNLPYEIIDQCALTETDLLFLENTKKKPLRFGYIGRLSEEKGILPIADYFSKTDLPFVIAGDGIQKEELLQIIEAKPNFRYIGLVNNESIGVFFDLIDVLIIPSYEESGPLVGLEAMAAGKIIFSTKVGAMEERLVGVKSFWFDIENLFSLQLILNEIEKISGDQLKNYSDEVRARYLSKYSFETIKLQYIKNVQQFLS